jgi:hypothetical protein
VCAQQRKKPLVATPSVTVPKLYKLFDPLLAAAAVGTSPSYPATSTAVAQSVAFTMRSLFEDASPVPTSWTVHGATTTHSTACVSGPESVKTPTSRLKSAFADGKCDQQSR